MWIDEVEFEKGPIFIVGTAKSGTTLLQSVLDGHPELCVIPVEIKFFKFPRLPSLPPANMPPSPLPTWKAPTPRGSTSINEMKAEIKNHSDIFRLLNGEEINRNISISKKDLDRKKFEKTINDLEPNTVRGLYISFLKAFHEAMDVNSSFQQTIFVEKTPSMEEYAQELREWFPRSKFINSLRNPYANIYSIGKGRKRKKALTRVVREFRKLWYFMERNERYMYNYKISKYEDLLIKPESHLKKISRFLGIRFDQILKEPTMLGDTWYGNSRSTNKDFSSIDPKPATAFRQKISDIDIAIINRYFSYFIKKYGYKKMKSSLIKAFMPSIYEFPHTYIINRSLLFRKNI